MVGGENIRIVRMLGRVQEAGSEPVQISDCAYDRCRLTQRREATTIADEPVNDVSSFSVDRLLRRIREGDVRLLGERRHPENRNRRTTTVVGFIRDKRSPSLTQPSPSYQRKAP